MEAAPAGWSDVGVLEDGEFDLDELSEIGKGGKYLMDLDGAKHRADGKTEEAAFTRYTPMWQLLKVDDKTMNRSAASLCFKWFLTETGNKAKSAMAAQKAKPTHVAMNSGNYVIEETSTDVFVTQKDGKKYSMTLNEETFLKLYAHAYLSGIKMYFIELKTPVFRLFMDLDFKQPEGIPAIKIEAVSYIVSNTVKKFFPGKETNFFRLICCSTTYKHEVCTGCKCTCYDSMLRADPACTLCNGMGCTGRAKEESKACEVCNGSAPVKKKTGVHLIWPEIYVTTEQCLDMRESVIADLILKFGHRTGVLNDWKDVVDESVYVKAGLRMLGSRKTEPCPKCKGKKKGETRCQACGGNGRVDQGRPYAPLFVTDGTGKRDPAREAAYLQDYHSLLLDTKIRTTLQNPESSFKVPDGAPTYETSGAGKKRGIGKTPTRAAKVAHESIEAEAIQEFFQTCLSWPQYRNVVVAQVSKTKTSYTVHVTGENCRYCQNIGRNHKSNRIFFVFVDGKAYQKCYDNSDVLSREMKHGLCRSYQSAGADLPGKLRNILFPATDADSVPSFFVASTSKANYHLKVQSLLHAGNILCKKVYGVEWTTSERFASMHGQRLMQVQQHMLQRDWKKSMNQQIYKIFRSDALGNKDDTSVLRELGYLDDVAEATEDEKLKEVQQQRNKKKGLREKLAEKTSLAEIRDDLHRCLTRIINVSLSLPETIAAERLKDGFEGLAGGLKVKNAKTASSTSLIYEE